MSQIFDIVIRGADVYDGTGGAPFVADVAVDADRIAAIGSLDGATGRLSIDAEGQALAPGFIDVHTHDDFAAIAHRDMGFKSRGGVTTCIVGNCGFGAAPYAVAVDMLGRLTPEFEIKPYEGHAGYAACLERNPPGINIGVLAGHGTLRMAAVGVADRAPTDKEMAHMKALLGEAIDAGVLGLSSGLIYEPGRYADTQELIELVSELHGTGGLYATHMRDEGVDLLQSVEEAITIGARAGVPVQISHHKASGRESWGLVNDSIKLIEAAQGRGESVHADQYPYTAGSTSMAAVLSNGIFDRNATGSFSNLAPEEVMIASAPEQGPWEGRTVADIAQSLNLSPRDAALKIAEQSPGVSVVLHMMSEDDVQIVLQHESTMIGSDGIPTLDGKPHPRLYNTFARVLGHYSRDLGLFDLATAIYRMTGFAADKFGLNGRGRIVEGGYADLVIFDAASIIDTGTFEDPNQYPEGISDVFVNGKVAVKEGVLAVLANEYAGHVVRRVAN